MRKLLLLTVLLLSVIGCRSVPLDKKYTPVKKVTECIFQPKGVITVIGDTVYVYSLKEWKLKFPPNSIAREASLRHEVVHSKRQEEVGLLKYLWKYSTDKKFRWEEEKLAVHSEISCYKSKGIQYNLEEKAYFLSGKYYYYMVSYEDALKWLKANFKN